MKTKTEKSINRTAKNRLTKPIKSKPIKQKPKKTETNSSSGNWGQATLRIHILVVSYGGILTPENVRRDRSQGGVLLRVAMYLCFIFVLNV